MLTTSSIIGKTTGNSLLMFGYLFQWSVYLRALANPLTTAIYIYSRQLELTLSFSPKHRIKQYDLLLSTARDFEKSLVPENLTW